MDGQICKSVAGYLLGYLFRFQFGEMHRSLQQDRRSHVANIQQMIDIVDVVMERLQEIREAMAAEVVERYKQVG